MSDCVTNERPVAAGVDAEPLFRSMYDACVFALNFNLDQYARPTINAMSAPATGNGKGLGGMDGAAQSGMIRDMIQSLGLLDSRVIIARIAPKWKNCDCQRACCSGRHPNREWLETIDWLTDYAVRGGMLAGCISHYRLRRGLIEKFFGVGVNIGRLAENCGVHRNTAGEQSAKIRKALEEAEVRACRKLEAVMKAARIVE